MKTPKAKKSSKMLSQSILSSVKISETDEDESVSDRGSVDDI